jgi:hypothetical protein
MFAFNFNLRPCTTVLLVLAEAGVAADVHYIDMGDEASWWGLPHSAVSQSEVGMCQGGIFYTKVGYGGLLAN